MLLTIIEIAVFMAAAAIIGAALGWVLRGTLGREQVEISDLRAQIRQLKKASRENQAPAKTQKAAAGTATTSKAAEKADTDAKASEPQKAAAKPAVKSEAKPKAKADSSAPPKASAKKGAKRKTQAEREADQAAGRAAFTEVIERIGKTGQVDNLTKIYGIGKRYEAMLNELGITAYAQVSALKKADRKTLAAALGVLDDRIETEDWVGSARKLQKEVG